MLYGQRIGHISYRHKLLKGPKKMRKPSYIYSETLRSQLTYPRHSQRHLIGIAILLSDEHFDPLHRLA